MTPAPASPAVPEPTNEPLRLGFARGVAPSKWKRRWRDMAPARPLALVALPLAFGGQDRCIDALRTEPGDEDCDVLIERAAPDEQPAGTAGPQATRHALLLYRETIALVVSADHELAKQEHVSDADLAIVTLLDHPDHAPAWPAAEPWADPDWMPPHPVAALELVAAGTGAILLPMPLARHLARKREHAILPVRTDPRLAPSTVWATWERERDGEDVQQLIGVLRGRTARSSRGASPAEPRDAQERARRTKAGAKSGATPAKKAAAKLKPNSRGAQLALAKAKQERKQAEARAAKRLKRNGR